MVKKMRRLKQPKITFIPLTINGEATRISILESFRRVKKYAQLRRISESTLSMILLEKYLHTSSHKKSTFQQILLKLNKDGLLVQKDQAGNEAE